MNNINYKALVKSLLAENQPIKDLKRSLKYYKERTSYFKKVLDQELYKTEKISMANTESKAEQTYKAYKGLTDQYLKAINILKNATI